MRTGNLSLGVLAVLALPLLVLPPGSGAVLVMPNGFAFGCSLARSGYLEGTTLTGEAFRIDLSSVTWIAGRDHRRIRLRDGSLIRARQLGGRELVCEGNSGNVALFAGQIAFYYSGEVPSDMASS